MLSRINKLFPPTGRKLNHPAIWAMLFFLIGLVAAQTSSNSQTSSISDLKVAPDLDARLTRFKPINMPFHQQGLSPREVQLCYDLVDEMKPFVGTDPAPPGRALYAPGLTRDDIEKYVQQHPDQKAAIYGDYTVVRRKGDALVAIPYHIEFAEFLKPAAAALREAAALNDDPGFAKFLRLRADALLDDDYYQSDLAWLELNNPKFDLILAPYETYLDNLLE